MEPDAVEVVVKVVVVTYNSAEVVAGLLESLAPAFDGMTWHLTVVDNDSTDATVSVVRELAPEADVIETGRNAGYAAAINRAVASIDTCTAVLILNPDVRLHAGCVAELVRATRQPATGLAAPMLFDANGDVIESQRREPTIGRAFADALLGAARAGRIRTWGEVVTDPASYRRPTVVDWAEGSTLLVTWACLHACGPWDEQFFLYSEETDFALRARDAGFVTRYVPSATATHLEGGSADNPKLWALVVTNRLRLYRKRHGAAASVAFWFALVLREATRSLVGRPTSRAALRALLNRRRLAEAPGPHTIR